MLAVSAYDRRGLLRDLTEVLARRATARSMRPARAPTMTPALAHFALTVAVRDLEQLARVLRRLSAVANVIEARRQR